MNSKSLHPLRPLLMTQATTAFCENAWKMVAIFMAARLLGAPGSPTFVQAFQTQSTLAALCFLVPFILGGLPTATLADRWNKVTLIKFVKVGEMLLMILGSWWISKGTQGASWVLMAILAGMGLLGSLLSPAKYSLLPEMFHEETLMKANAQLETVSLAAVIAGIAAGGPLLALSDHAPWLFSAIMVGIAGVGVVSAYSLPMIPPALRMQQATTEGQSGLRADWSALTGDKLLWMTALGLAAFWGLSQLLIQDVVVHAKATLGLGESTSGILMASCAMGVGMGCLMCARLAGPFIEVGYVPLGAFGMFLFPALMSLLDPGFSLLALLMLLTGVSGGFVLVPLNSQLQTKTPPFLRGSVIALSNSLSFSAMLLGSGMAWLATKMGHTTQDILVLVSLLGVGGTIWALREMPLSLVRLLLVLLTHSIYRLQSVGAHNVPHQGGALLVPNHVSLIDWLFIIASQRRTVRFIVDSGYYHHPLTQPWMKLIGAIPISSSGGPRVVLRALRDAGDYLDKGELVCLFPEGQITRTGMMQTFRRGVERIAKGRNAPIIPVHLDHLWGSLFSFAGGRFLWKAIRQLPYRVTVIYGTPLAPDTPVPEIRKAVHDLSAEAWELRRAHRRPLHLSFARECRRHPFRTFLIETGRAPLGRLKALASALALSRALIGPWMGQSHVGILLPPGMAGTLANIAAAFSGKVSVNLNFTAGDAALRSACQQAGLRTVLTARTVLEKTKTLLPSGVEPLWVEDILPSISALSRLQAIGAAFFLPLRNLEDYAGAVHHATLDNTATVIFSSGSTGEPKGVELTHFNIDSNVEAAAQVFRAGDQDRILGILPLFHSFGMMAMWYASNHGLGLVCHSTPLDAAAIGDLVQEHDVTMLLATPTFLQLYMRRCTPAQFGSLRLVMTGAEKLPERLADAFDAHFGIRPLEGYGATECAPAIAVSAPDYRASGFYQPGSRRGSVGQALPGMAVRVVDPTTREDLPTGVPGLLLVRGASVMKGYLGREDLTKNAFHEGWYVTGDIASIDDDGFIRITDRLSRFSKIGGEMVPHGRVEQLLHESAGTTEMTFAVTSIPDERKGERLAVLHTCDSQKMNAALKGMLTMGLPNLFIPQIRLCFEVGSLPLLGSGKLDLKSIHNMAQQAVLAQDGTVEKSHIGSNELDDEATSI